MLSEIINAINLMQSPEDRAQVYLAIADQFNQNADPEEAIPHIEQALQELAKLPTDEKSLFWHFKVVKQLFGAGQRTRSEELLAELLCQARAIEAYESRAREIAEVSATYAEIGLFDQALQVAQEIEDDYHKDFQAFESIVDFAILRSQHSQVEAILSTIQAPSDRDAVLQIAAGAYSSYGHPARALALIQQIISPESQVWAIRNVFIELVWRQADLEQWLELLKAVEAFAESETNPSVKAQALRIMAQQRIRLSQFDQAKALLEEAGQIAESISTHQGRAPVSRDAVLQDIADAFNQLDEQLARQSAQADSELIIQNVREIRTAENASVEGDAYIADLERVLQAQHWADQGMTEQVLGIAAQISDASLKDLALRLAGISKREYLDDVVEKYEKVCSLVSKQPNREMGLSVLQKVLAQVPALDNCATRPTVDRSIDFRSGYKASLLVAIVEAYFQLLRSAQPNE